MAKQEIIPQAVIEFGKPQEGGKVIFIRDWNNYKVFRISYPELEKGCLGLPAYILFDGHTARWATQDENDDIRISFFPHSSLRPCKETHGLII